MPARNIPRTVDVVVVGGGPTSLITSFILAKNGVDVMIVGMCASRVLRF